MNVLFSIVFCIAVSYAFVELFRRLRFSGVAAMIVAGILTGSSVVRQALLDPNTELIYMIGDIGLLCIMFIAGLEVSWSVLSREKRDAAFVAVFAAVVPFVLGSLAFLAMGFGLEVSIFAGICISVTAEATKAKVLVDMEKLETKIGSLMIGTGIIDDVFGMGLFILFGYMFAIFPIKDVVLLSGAIIMFFFGVIVHRQIGRTKNKIPLLEKIIFYFVSPFFFVSMGMNFSTRSIIIEPFLLLIILALAFGGKILGTILTKPFTKLKLMQLFLVGLGMNSRGAVELALLFVAFKTGLLPVYVYSGLVAMALITTLIFPILFTRFVRKNPKIMN